MPDGAPSRDRVAFGDARVHGTARRSLGTCRGLTGESEILCGTLRSSLGDLGVPGPWSAAVACQTRIVPAWEREGGGEGGPPARLPTGQGSPAARAPRARPDLGSLVGGGRGARRRLRVRREPSESSPRIPGVLGNFQVCVADCGIDACRIEASRSPLPYSLGALCAAAIAVASSSSARRLSRRHSSASQRLSVAWFVDRVGERQSRVRHAGGAELRREWDRHAHLRRGRRAGRGGPEARGDRSRSAEVSLAQAKASTRTQQTRSTRPSRAGRRRPARRRGPACRLRREHPHGSYTTGQNDPTPTTPTEPNKQRRLPDDSETT